MSTYYPGICDKYMIHWARSHGPNGAAAGILAGLGLTFGMVNVSTAGLYYSASKAQNFLWCANVDPQQYIQQGMVCANVGLAFAFVAKVGANVFISGKDIGLTRGGKIVRRVQATTYAIPVIAGLFFNSASVLDQKETETLNDKIDIVEHMQPAPLLKQVQEFVYRSEP